MEPVSTSEHTRLNKDDLPVFTYVADGAGACHGCSQMYRPGATVVRVGVMWAVGECNGWKTYHDECYKLLRHKEIRT